MSTLGKYIRSPQTPRTLCDVHCFYGSSNHYPRQPGRRETPKLTPGTRKSHSQPIEVGRGKFIQQFRFFQQYTAKNSQVVTRLLTSCHRLVINKQPIYTRKSFTTCSKSANKPSTSVFALLVTSCQQV